MKDKSSRAMTQHRIAVVVYASLDGDGESRVYRALMFVRELIEAGDSVSVVFDGSGTRSLAAISDPSHDLHLTFERVRGAVAGACRFCAISYGVLDAIEQLEFPLLRDYHGHASLRHWLETGHQLVTF